MLELIRKNAQGIVIWIIVGFVTLGLSSFMLSSYIGGDVKNYIAKVNDTEISKRDFQMAFNNYQQQLQQSLGENYSRFFNEESMRGTVVNGLVNNELMYQLTLDAGFRAGGNQILAEIEKNPRFKDAAGVFSSKLYEQRVRQIGLSKQGYEQELAQYLVQKQLNEGVTKTTFALDSTAREFHRLEHQQRDIDYLIIKKARLLKTVTVSDDGLKKYYNAHLKEFLTEEQIKLAYIELNLKAIAKSIEVDIDDVREYYNANKANYRKDDYAFAEKKIKQIEKRLKKGGSFEKLAKEFSQDPGSAANGGDLGFMAKGILEKAFEDALFALNKGQTSKPVRDKYGYHLIKLEEIRKAERRARHILIKPRKISQSFNDVKNRIRDGIQLTRAEKQFYEDADKLDRLSYEFQDSLEPAMEQLGQKIKQSPFITRKGGGQIWRNQDVLSAAFGESVLKEGLNSELIKLSDDHVLVLRVKEYRSAEQKPLSAVKNQIKTRLHSEMAEKQAAELADKIFADSKTGKSLSSLSKSNNAVSMHSAGFIGRKAQFDAKRTKKIVISSELRNAAFRMAKPVEGKAVHKKIDLANGDSAVIVLKAVRDTSDDDKNQLDSIKRSLADIYAKANSKAILDYKRTHSEVKIVKQEENTQ